jgi:hypothetical protein
MTIPVVLAALLAPFVVPSEGFSRGAFLAGATNITDHTPISDPTISSIEISYLVDAARQAASLDEDEHEGDEGAEEMDAEEESELQGSQITTAETAEEPKVALQGGKWDAELHDAVAPTCSHHTPTSRYQGKIKTGFVSFPRSGNSYMRSLVERATAFQTSSVCASVSFGGFFCQPNARSLVRSDCDRGLEKTFVGECDEQATFFVKVRWGLCSMRTRPRQTL